MTVDRTTPEPLRFTPLQGWGPVTAAEVLASAANDPDLDDGVFIVVARALEGRDVTTGGPMTATRIATPLAPWSWQQGGAA